MAVSPIGLLLFLALMGGDANDLVSWINAEDYFKARNVQVSVEQMVRLAGQEPKDGKSSIQQLLAIRWLGQHPNEVKKAKEARALLDHLAQGKGPQDPQGFAKDYAGAALARLDGKKAPAPGMPANSVANEALKWLPEHVTVAGGIDLRGAGGSTSSQETVKLVLAALTREDDRGALHDFADYVGNFRVDRAAFGVSFDPVNPKRGGKIYLRITGRGQPARLAGFMSLNIKESLVTEGKTADGQELRRLETKNREPAMAFLGDSDFIVAFQEGAGAQNGGPLIDEVLEVRAGKKKSLLSGRLADLVKLASKDPHGLVVADWPEEVHTQFQQNGGVLTLLPRRMLLELTGDKGRTLRGRGVFERPEDAKMFAESVDKLRKQGVDRLKELTDDDLKQLRLTKETVAVLKKTLEGAKLEADGKGVTGSADVPGELPKMFLELLQTGRRAPLPPDENP